MKFLSRVAVMVALLALLPGLALAGPRSGASFSGRSGFRSSPGAFSRGVSPGRTGYGGGGTSFFFFPSFGWGWGGYGGGFGLMGSLVLLGVVGLGTVAVVRALRRARRGGDASWSHGDEDEELDRAYVYKLQVGLGRSARHIQERLADFASQGDTTSEAGLAEMLHQTALELLREKDSLRYGLAEVNGPMSMTNGETKLGASAMAERSRFQVERIRAADGSVRRAQAASAVGAEALEYLVVTVILASRVPLGSIKAVADREALETALRELGSVPAQALLGLEVIWTPADPEDSMTETDLMTTYPEMRSL